MECPVCLGVISYRWYFEPWEIEASPRREKRDPRLKAFLYLSVLDLVHVKILSILPLCFSIQYLLSIPASTILTQDLILSHLAFYNSHLIGFLDSKCQVETHHLICPSPQKHPSISPGVAIIKNNITFHTYLFKSETWKLSLSPPFLLLSICNPLWSPITFSS